MKEIQDAVQEKEVDKEQWTEKEKWQFGILTHYWHSGNNTYTLDV
jgi:hypothetical protein